MQVQQHWIEAPEGTLFAQSWDVEQGQGAPVVLLHDSLGCVALWRDFPERLAQATGRKVIAYDRLGFGRSARHSGTLSLSFVEDEAKGDFQAVCQFFKLHSFVVFGHSVGAGMAIGCAGAHANCQGVITESAQAFVEALTLDGIRQAKQTFTEAGQMQRLEKYHGDKAQWVLHAWTDTWLSDEFSDWRLDEQLRQVSCPILALHGDSDEFGTTHHLERIAEQVKAPVSLHVFADCGHVPHRQYPDEVLERVCMFLSPLA